MNEVRLIDANEVLKHVIPVRGEYDDSCPFPAVGVPHINGAPTIEAEPIIYGEWIYTPNAINWKAKDTCSACGFHRPNHEDMSWAKRCPNCGAKMEGGDNHDN